MSTPNLVPRNHIEGRIGRSDRRWAEGHFEQLYLRGGPAVNQEELTEQLDALEEGIQVGASSFELDGNGDLMPIE